LLLPTKALMHKKHHQNRAMEEIRICAFFDALGTREIMMGSDLFMRHALIDLIRGNF
jgi:hypothetical protein